MLTYYFGLLLVFLIGVFVGDFHASKGGNESERNTSKIR